MNLVSERKKIKKPVFRSTTGEMIKRGKKERKGKRKTQTGKKCVCGNHLNFLETFP